MDFNEYSRTFLHFHSDELPDLLLKYLDGAEVVADLGAGDGAFLVALKMRGYIDNIKSVIAVDLSPERCERLKKYTDFKVVCADVTNVPDIDSSSVDYVICTQVIEHVDQYALLKEINRILKPGGTLYIASLIKSWYGWWYYKTPDGRWALDPTHLREYRSQDEFEQVLREGGFQILNTVMSPLKLSLMEFIIRRIITPLFKPADVNSFFVRHPFWDKVRRNINIHPLGYFIIETVANKNA